MIEQEEDPTNEYLDLPLDDVDEEADEFDIDEFED
jgi:hypothetical protein